MMDLAAQKALDDLSVDGRRFVVQSLDPFHDTPYQLTGLPDSYSGNSLLYRVEKSFVVSKPPSLAAGATFDANIAFIPVVTSTVPGILKGLKNGFWGPYPGTQFFSAHLVENTNTDLDIGGLTCSSAPTSVGYTFDADGIAPTSPY